MGAPMSSGNRGVAALGASLVKLIWQSCPDADVQFIIAQRSSAPCHVIVNGVRRAVPVLHYRNSPRSGLAHQIYWILLMAIFWRMIPITAFRNMIARRTPMIGAMVDSDVVGDIRGGDSFSDIYGLRWFVEGCVPTWIALLVRGNIVMFPQTYGPFKSPIARAAARLILRRSRPMLSRDKVSFETISALVGNSNAARFCPDVAFMLEPAVVTNPKIEPPLEFTGKTVVGINVNGYMYHGGFKRDNNLGLKFNYPQFLEKTVKSLLEQTDCEVLLVPHTFAPPHLVQSDPGACQLLRQKLGPAFESRVHLVTHSYDQHEIKGIIGQCDFFIGSRMHSCIAALSQGVPTVGVAYSRKFIGVFESVGVGACVVDGATCDTDAAQQRVLELFRAKDKMQHDLDGNIQRARQLVQDTFNQLLRRSDDDCPSVNQEFNSTKVLC